MIFRFILPLLLALSACSDAPKAPASAPLFATTLTDAEGRIVALERYRGKPLIVNFWARWCPPCREEIPELKRIQALQGEQGLEVVGIGIEEDHDGVLRFINANAMNYPVLLTGDQGNALMKAVGNNTLALPYTLAIDREGRIVGRKLGLMRRADVDALAGVALGKAPGKP
ncbi:MAG: TlpA family protein disulfide reductase [Betaproteobacteria bacterium]